jgi:sorting nexin-17
VETFEQDSSKQVEFDIFLLNGFRICCAVVPSECSQTVLKKALEKINLPENLWKYFCLYLIKEEDGRKTIIKRLMDFMESACVTLSQSQKVYQNEFKIVIRTNYWDRQTDLELMQNDVGLNLLTIQASADFENGWLEPSNAVKNQLSNFQSNNMRKEFIKCCSVLPFYGCIHLAAIKTDFIENAQTIIIGNNELVIRDKTQETNFKVPRIKCWRVSTFTNEKDKSKKTAKYELSFEYLMAKNTLKWIKLVSEKYETICLISLSLQVGILSFDFWMVS